MPLPLSPERPPHDTDVIRIFRSLTRLYPENRISIAWYSIYVPFFQNVFVIWDAGVCYAYIRDFMFRFRFRFRFRVLCRHRVSVSGYVGRELGLGLRGLVCAGVNAEVRVRQREADREREKRVRERLAD